ncbi:hypothetical protein AB0R12_21990, partial [Streptomyces niveus]
MITVIGTGTGTPLSADSLRAVAEATLVVGGRRHLQEAASEAGLPERISRTPHAQPLPGITHIRFGLIRFRSPLLPESRLF